MKKYSNGIVIIAVSFLYLFGGKLSAATVSVYPSTIPIGAYVNGAGGDQQFFQVINIEDVAQDHADGQKITISLPASMNVADPDDDGSYDDGISTIVTGAVGLTVTISANSSTVILTIAGAAGGLTAAGNDDVYVLIPVTSAESPTSLNENYTGYFQ